ncbi:MAG: acyl carrier protein [Lachnospiraceae bacterium]|nr:acyl carrier protein [Lachnospiraceae bacterium]MBQ8260856.1 acyl carrier protein [Lachnospiraceae bacterium]
MEVKKELQEIFRDIFDDEDLVITEETTAEDIEDWDSLTHIQLIVAIEKKFQIKFSATEIKSSENVGEFVKMIEKKVEKEA